MQYLLNKKDVSEYRREIKYTIPNVDRSMIVRKIKESSAMFSEVYYQRYVNNIYYDTYDFGAYFTSTSGLSPRIKVRFRWYGDLFGVINPVLEFKMKRSDRNSKLSYALDPIRVLENSRMSSVKQKINENKAIPVDIKNIIKSLKPTLLNRYLRSYFLSEDKKSRITIDSQLSFSPLADSIKFKQTKVIPKKFIVLEMKFSGTDDKASRIMTEISSSFYLSKMSKYSMGLEI